MFYSISKIFGLLLLDPSVLQNLENIWIASTESICYTLSQNYLDCFYWIPLFYSVSELFGLLLLNPSVLRYLKNIWIASTESICFIVSQKYLDFLHQIPPFYSLYHDKCSKIF